MTFHLDNNSSKQTPVASVKTVSGQRLAKAGRGYPRWQRALDAAHWTRGELRVEPTNKLAAQTFGVNVLLVREARKHLEDQERRERDKRNGGTLTFSDAAVECIVAKIGPERILGVVDKLTSPELPLTAANN